MFGLAAWLNMQIGFIASGGSAFDGRVFFLLPQLLKLIEDLLGDQIALLHPTFDATRGPNFGKTLLAIENIYAVAVFRDASFVVNLRQLVAKRDLRSGNVVRLQHSVVPASTAGEQGGGNHSNKDSVRGVLHGVQINIAQCDRSF